MDVKGAVARAKQEIKALFGDEGISDLGLEEVEYEDDQHKWRVTIGFSRPWDRPKQKHKHLHPVYTATYFDLLVKQLSCFSVLMLTPNTVSETSNLIDHIGDPARTHIY